MLPYSEWLENARALSLGHSKRVQHCGNSTSMKISHDEEGYHAYCFRCSDYGFKAHGLRRLRDVFAERRFMNAKVQLPYDYTTDYQTIPEHAAAWLYKSGVSASCAASYGIGYSPAMDRIILPVYDGVVGGTLAVVQARAVSPRHEPKYLNQEGVGKGEVLFVSHRGYEGPSCVCITEDILSAIRVGEVMPAVSPLGTSLSDAQAGKLAKCSTVYIWLDPDEAGEKGAIKMRRKLLTICKQVYIIKSTHDPKYYCNQEIKRILNLT